MKDALYWMNGCIRPAIVHVHVYVARGLYRQLYRAALETNQIADLSIFCSASCFLIHSPASVSASVFSSAGSALKQPYSRMTQVRLLFCLTFCGFWWIGFTAVPSEDTAIHPYMNHKQRSRSIFLQEVKGKYFPSCFFSPCILLYRNVIANLIPSSAYK